MKTIAVIQARYDSSRLPGKALMDLGGLPVLAWLIRAVDAAPGIDYAVIATSVEETDNPIVDWCEENEIVCYRGPKEDVLRRFSIAVEGEQADIALRLTGDCPFHDPQVLGGAVAMRSLTNADYVTSAQPETWPDGLDCEVFTREALLAADQEAVRPSEREAVTRFFRFRRPRFSVQTYACPLPGLSSERWTLDYPEDLEFMRQVIERLGADKPLSYLDVLALLEREPQLRDLNKEGVHNLGVSEVLNTDVETGSFYQHSYSQSAAYQNVEPTNTDSPLLTFGLRGHVWDVDGNEYIDLDLGVSPLLFGHANAEINEAISLALHAGVSLPRTGYNRLPSSERIAARFPIAERSLFYGSMKETRDVVAQSLPQISGRDKVAVLGPTPWCQQWQSGSTNVSLTDNGRNIEAFIASLKSDGNEFSHCIISPFADFDIPESCHSLLSEVLSDKGIALVVDETETALHCGPGGGAKMLGLNADLVMFGPNLANGLGFACLGGAEHLINDIDGRFSNEKSLRRNSELVFPGEQLVFAAINCVLDKLETVDPQAALSTFAAKVKTGATEAIRSANLSERIRISGPALLPRIVVTDPDDLDLRHRLQLALKSNGVLISRHMAYCLSHGNADAAAITGGWARAIRMVSQDQ
jgi:glutamate-1-semialdehyde 2,1-aminomutase